MERGSGRRHLYVRWQGSMLLSAARRRLGAKLELLLSCVCNGQDLLGRDFDREVLCMNAKAVWIVASREQTIIVVHAGWDVSRQAYRLLRRTPAIVWIGVLFAFPL